MGPQGRHRSTKHGRHLRPSPEDYDGVDKFTGEPQAGVPRKLNLNHLTFHLPFDKVEYEPEQFLV